MTWVDVRVIAALLGAVLLVIVVLGRPMGG